MKKFDVIIIGGGHNGLVASSYLAKKGKKVLVIEKNEHIGKIWLVDQGSRSIILIPEIP